MIIRKERPADYQTVEKITREAFWNQYAPGATEHYLVHQLRTNPYFVPELSLVAISNNQIVGHISYCDTDIVTDDGDTFNVVTFAPVSVKKSAQNQGVGSHLVSESLKLAKEMGFKAVVIQGYPWYYDRFGFKNAYHFGVSNSLGHYPIGMLILELVEGCLDGINGKFNDEGRFFEPTPEQLESFEEGFPPMEKFVTVGQKVFERIIGMVYGDPVPEHYKNLCHNLQNVDDNFDLDSLLLPN
eukprot:TRINITY_DN5538_c0_g1_i2.p1 TRINITY_DN5538_c0_g1~~TRINITY_DN5538_c0_g1_i2.p1  ORF type:complete len:242 (-),score=48.29 TRINITY_DN5538_c0_g1_i2:30-755(-)